MSITLLFGNVGSGKTASCVRMMKMSPQKNYITNINVHGKGFNHVTKLKADMILKKELIKEKKSGEKVYKLTLNVDFWKDLIKKQEKVNIIIDESHVFFNPRRSMSRINIIMTDFLALLRRVLGGTDDTGELILVTQLSRRLDVICKEMSTKVTYCINHYQSNCKKCSFSWQESNETPNKQHFCKYCGSHNIKKIKSVIEVYDFQNIDSFMMFKDYGQKSYYNRYLIKDIESVYNNYDTLQFDDLLSEY